MGYSSGGVGPRDPVRVSSQEPATSAASGNAPHSGTHGWVAKLINAAEVLPGIGAAVVLAGLYVKESHRGTDPKQITNDEYLKHVLSKPNWQAAVEIALPIFGKGITLVYDAHKSRSSQAPQGRVESYVDEEMEPPPEGRSWRDSARLGDKGAWGKINADVEKDASAIRNIGEDRVIMEGEKPLLLAALKKALQKDGSALQYITADKFYKWGLTKENYRDLALTAVGSNGAAIQHLTEEKCKRWGLTKDEYQWIGSNAVMQNVGALQYVKPELCENFGQLRDSSERLAAYQMAQNVRHKR